MSDVKELEDTSSREQYLAFAEPAYPFILGTSSCFFTPRRRWKFEENMRTFKHSSPWVQALTEAERAELEAAAQERMSAHDRYIKTVEKLRNRAKARVRREASPSEPRRHS